MTGFALAMDDYNRNQLFNFFLKHFGSLLKLFDLYHNAPETEILVLRFFEAITRYVNQFREKNFCELLLKYSIKQMVDVFYVIFLNLDFFYSTAVIGNPSLPLLYMSQ